MVWGKTIIIETLSFEDEDDLSSHTDGLRGSSRVLAPQTSAETSGKFLSHCSQISAGAHVLIIGEPVDAVEVN